MLVACLCGAGWSVPDKSEGAGRSIGRLRERLRWVGWLDEGVGRLYRANWWVCVGMTLDKPESIFQAVKILTSKRASSWLNL